MRMRIIKAALIASLMTGTMVGISSPAQAQMAVVDVRAIAQAVQTARNTVQQLQEAKKMYQTLNSISNIRNVSQLLNNPLLQEALPQDMRDSSMLISSDLRQLGAIGDRAEAILSSRNLDLSGLDGRLGDAQGILRTVSNAQARDQALGERMMEATEATGEGLAQLNNSLAASTSLRQSQDIAARAAIENAAVSNRMLQIMSQQQAAGAQSSVNSSAAYAASQRAEQENINNHARPTFTPRQ